MALFDFHLLKLEHALIFQIIDQKIYGSVFEKFQAFNDWVVDCDSNYYPSIELPTKTVHVRSGGNSIEDKYHTQVLMFNDNNERDKIHNEIKSALREWAIKAREINEIYSTDN